MRVRLGDVVAIVSRQVDPRVPSYSSLPLINGENIESGTTRLLFRRTAADERAISPKYLVEPGDVVYSKLRPYLRKVVLATEVGLCSADSYPLRPDLSVIDPRWLTWMLVSDQFTSYAASASARARMPKLNRGQLFAYEFDLPPVDEQAAIASGLSVQLDLVAAAIRAIEPARDELAALELSLIRRALDAETTLTKRLGDICDIRIGRTPSRAESTFWNGSHPWASIADLAADPVKDTLERVSDEAVARARLRSVAPGTLLYSFKLTIGRMAVAGTTLYTNEAIAAIEPKDAEVTTDYLRLALRVTRPNGMAHAVKGATLNSASLAEILVPLAPPSRQVVVVDRLKSQMTAIETASIAIADRARALHELRSTLVHKAFQRLDL